MSHSFIDPKKNYYNVDNDSDTPQKKIDPVAQLKWLNTPHVHGEWGLFHNQPAQTFAQDEIKGNGLPINDNPVLENEADEMGVKAAQGKMANVVGKVHGVQKKGEGDPPDENEVNLGKEGVKAYKFSGSTMTPFVSGDATLSESGKSQDKSGTTEYTINTQFLEGSFLSGYNNQGKSYAGGKSLGGSSQKGWYYIAQDKEGKYTFGKGDPPENSYSAIGGGRPLIVDGLSYGAINKYKEGAPTNLPEKGDPGTDNKKYLTQRSAAYFLAQNSVTKGKTIIAQNPTSGEIMIIVQQDGVEGYSMDAYRNYLVKKGFTDALSFDGSDSALLIKDKSVLIKNGSTKDNYTDGGVTFSVPVKN